MNASGAAERQQQRLNDLTAGRCRECGRVVRAVNPPGGDGSIRIAVVHGPRAARCPGSRLTIAGMGDDDR